MAILIRRGFIFSAIAFVLLGTTVSASVNEALEYQVKAAFLFNFLKFVEWPAAAKGSPWVIGVLGHDPFGGVLEDTVRGKVVNGRAVDVRRYAHAADVKDCDILFIGRADYERLGTPMGPGLLTVGESPGFLKSGGIINFYLEENRVHFEIRPSSARLAGLQVSSQLLKLGAHL